MKNNRSKVTLFRIILSVKNLPTNAWLLLQSFLRAQNQQVDPNNQNGY
jgi:hypothetical protein